MTSILQSEKYIEKCIDVWIEKLNGMADDKESFDLWVWTRMYSRTLYAFANANIIYHVGTHTM
jgi:hypothetical protein